ncbi:hypothetical protein [Paenibacillus sp. YN15]|uniref:hypothetical protein n=1 Tax=Paenibacillus sp. YN15 TaxID=1742774 RepID=UPI000DCF08A7|nr:hypothetical protein [Paenibacillus sp. YN15]RAU91706.1 hypothetical protein DQG13_28865 [Paenibacillus sp. YN15]
MAYCTQCGAELTEEPHLCSAAGQPMSGKVDTSLLLHLLKKPQAGLSLSPGKDFLYGFIGIGASLLGFFLWGLALKKELVSSIAGSVGSVDFFGGAFSQAVKGAGKKVPLASNLLLLAIISLVVLFGTLWLLGNWKGRAKRDWKDIITYFGAMQLTFGAVYAIAAILAFISLNLSILLVVIGLLTSLVMTCFAAQEIYGYSEDQRFIQFGLAMAIYVVITLTASNLLLKDAVSSLLL